MRYLICFTWILLLGYSNLAQAQDPHFSQFYSSPLNFNPALAGTIDGTFRINTIYRDQWTSALSDPLTTFSLGADIKLPMQYGQLKKKPDLLGIGINFNADKVSTFDLNSTSVSMLLAYHKSLNQRKDRYLGMGFLVGIVQKNINYEDLVFEDQFNTLDNFNLPTSESFPTNNFGIIDLGVGLNYSDKSSDYNINAGLAYFHFHKPNISFYSQEDCASCVVETRNVLKPRLAGYFSFTRRLSETFSLSPRLLAQIQDQFKEVTIGNNFIFDLPKSPNNSFHVGAWLRAVDGVENFGIESIILMAGFERKNILIGFSYDHNLKDLTTNRVGLNAFEISLTYIGEHDNSFDICPKF